MTKEKFKQLVDKGEKVYLYFFSPFCGGCELTTPLLIKSKYEVFEINGLDNEELMDALAIETYPTIVELQNKTIRKFEGRDAITNLLS